MFELQGVIVCVEYGDFLAHTLPLNRGCFNDLVVVSDTRDTRTHAICEHYHTRCIQTDAFFADGQAFNKAAGINAGLDALGQANGRWTLHLDADIILPPRFGDLIRRANLDPNAIYGADRLMCRSYEDWMAYVAGPQPQHTSQVFVAPDAFPVGTRVARLTDDGYVPIGYFQLWNSLASGVRGYPAHSSAARGDMLHALRWPRRLRHLIPEIFVIHLESEDTGMGENWRGRRSKHFGPHPRWCPDPRQPPRGHYGS